MAKKGRKKRKADSDEEEHGAPEKKTEKRTKKNSEQQQELKPLPASYRRFALSLVTLANGNVMAKIPSKKKEALKARLRELSLRVENSLAQTRIYPFNPPNFDTLPHANKLLHETAVTLQHQVADIIAEKHTQEVARDETDEYVQEYKEKSKKIKKVHESSHRNQLHPSLRNFPDVDTNDTFNTFDFSKSYRNGKNDKRNHNLENDDEGEQEEEEEEDEELEKVKEKLAPKLARIAQAQRSAQHASATVARAHDVAQVLVNGSKN